MKARAIAGIVFIGIGLVLSVALWIVYGRTAFAASLFATCIVVQIISGE